jgi:hypothetical protein
MAPATVGRNRGLAERRFYSFMSLAIFAAVYVGFAKTFFLRPWFPEATAVAAPEPFFYLHGAVFATWFVLLVVQPNLVAAGRTDLHRMVGKFGAAVAASMVVVGVVGAVIAARREGGFMGVPIPPAQFLTIPLMDMVMFTVLVGAALVKRRDVQAHKRLMLIGSIAVMDAAVARWPGIGATSNPVVTFFVLTDLFLVPLVIWDLRTRGRLHPATLWGGLLLIASQPFRLWLSGTAAWLGFASRLI